MESLSVSATWTMLSDDLVSAANWAFCSAGENRALFESANQATTATPHNEAAIGKATRRVSGRIRHARGARTVGSAASLAATGPVTVSWDTASPRKLSPIMW